MKKDKKNKKKLKEHVVYNKKIFLVPDSIRSLSAIHTKVQQDGLAKITLSDCNGSIRWWNDLNNTEEVKEMLQKIDSTVSIMLDFRDEIKTKLP